MIPKLIHLIWLGSKRPEKFDYFLKRISDINFDYKVIEWNENNIDFELITKELYFNSENLGAKSDLLRFEILFRYGGIYIDYDFLQIKKFDELLSFDFFAGAHESTPNEVWNSIIGSSKNNIICKKFLNSIKLLQLGIKNNEIDRVMNETGPYKLTSVFNEVGHLCKSKIFIGSYFFPFDPNKRVLIRQMNFLDALQYIENFKKSNTFCIHFHTTSWQ
jgi:mannosyltransferase OCH1-like enzyme